MGSSPHPSLQTCTTRPSPQPKLGSLCLISQLLEAGVFILQLAMVVLMSLMGTTVWAASLH